MPTPPCLPRVSWDISTVTTQKIEFMPTIITHAIVPLTIAAVVGERRVPRRIALVGAALAMLPDMDVIGFRLGVPYDSVWGHRGAMHSLAIAALVVGALVALVPALRRGWAAPFLFAAMASHGLLDTLTDGGLGVALFWPFDVTRHFAPWRPIRVSPIGARFFTPRGLATLASEAQFVWLPCLAIALPCMAWRWRGKAPKSN